MNMQDSCKTWENCTKACKFLREVCKIVIESYKNLKRTWGDTYMNMQDSCKTLERIV